MLIQNCMTPRNRLVLARVTSTVEEVVQQLRREGLDFIPVVDSQDCFAGVTGYGPIMKLCLHKGWTGDTGSHPVSEAVEWVKPLTLESDFEETLPIIIRHPFAPIVEADGATLAGIAKISDIESALAQTMGTGIHGVRLLIGIFMDMPHVLERLLQVLKPFNVNIVSLATFDSGKPTARRILLKLAPTPHVEMIRQSLDSSGFRVLSARSH